ncbi:hypothetical protein ACHAPT_012971 [Fusarium lateritium]
MTEIFGAVSGAISIASLFNNCVDCFEYIQLARHFGQDYGRCQLSLDVAKWRLGRWGAAIDINNNPRFGPDAPADASVARAQAVLQEIVGRFELAYKISRRYEKETAEQDRALFTHADLDPASQRLRQQFQAVIKKRQNRTSLIKKTGWALYDKKQLGSLIDDIVSSMDQLALVFPVDTQASTQLVRMEIEKVDEQRELKMVQDVAKGVDPVLDHVAKQKSAGAVSQNSVNRVKTTEFGRASVGNIFTKEALGQSVGFSYSASNRVDDIEAKDNSRVNVGDTYGAKGFWD